MREPFIRPNLSARVGLILLLLPTCFIVSSLLSIKLPWLSLIGNPIVLVGSLLFAFTLNVLSVLSVGVDRDSPPILNLSLALRLSNLAVIVTASLLMTVLLGYAFVENLQLRPVS